MNFVLPSSAVSSVHVDRQDRPFYPPKKHHLQFIKSSDFTVMCQRLGDNSLMSCRQPQRQSQLFTHGKHSMFEVPVTVCYHSHVQLPQQYSESFYIAVNVSPEQALLPAAWSCGLCWGLWGTAVILILTFCYSAILSAVWVSLHTAAYCNISPF